VTTPSRHSNPALARGEDALDRLSLGEPVEYAASRVKRPGRAKASPGLSLVRADRPTSVVLLPLAFGRGRRSAA